MPAALPWLYLVLCALLQGGIKMLEATGSRKGFTYKPFSG